MAELSTQDAIRTFSDNFRDFLLEKNRRYGDSALHPARVFSKADASNSILIRLDDKLNRIQNSEELRENDIQDLIGYLHLYCVSKGWLDPKKFLD